MEARYRPHCGKSDSRALFGHVFMGRGSYGGELQFRPIVQKQFRRPRGIPKDAEKMDPLNGYSGGRNDFELRAR